jgi:hypothetical protein
MGWAMACSTTSALAPGIDGADPDGWQRDLRVLGNWQTDAGDDAAQRQDDGGDDGEHRPVDEKLGHVRSLRLAGRRRIERLDDGAGARFLQTFDDNALASLEALFDQP